MPGRSSAYDQPAAGEPESELSKYHAWHDTPTNHDVLSKTSRRALAGNITPEDSVDGLAGGGRSEITLTRDAEMRHLSRIHHHKHSGVRSFTQKRSALGQSAHAFHEITPSPPAAPHVVSVDFVLIVEYHVGGATFSTRCSDSAYREEFEALKQVVEEFFPRCVVLANPPPNTGQFKPLRGRTTRALGVLNLDPIFCKVCSSAVHPQLFALNCLPST